MMLVAWYKHWDPAVCIKVHMWAESYKVKGHSKKKGRKPEFIDREHNEKVFKIDNINYLSI